MPKQRGLSIIGLVFILFIVIVVALFAMKVVPSFIEYRSAKTAIEAIAAQNPGTPAEVRRAFESRATIDNIETVKPTDLEITKDGGAIVIGFSYRKEIPLFKNVGVYIDYVARAGGQ
jgi:exopolysaccharide biosynthesis protein